MSPRIVFATSELYPLVKTGGLADVAASLPAALTRRGAELRVALPAYRGWRAQMSEAAPLATVDAAGHSFTVWQARHPQLPFTLWLFDCAALFDRPGDPYHDAEHHPWSDNGLRFGAFSDAVAQIAAQPRLGGFDADIVHGNDWQAGLIMPWLRERRARAASVFSIHNLAHQGVFSASLSERLGLPAAWWHLEGVELHGQLSQMKAGIAYADAVTTVSPSYAREIQRPEFGMSLDGLLRARARDLHGILNGIDDEVWNPATDAQIVRRYDARIVAAGKRSNKSALQQQLGLAPDADAAIVGLITRFAEQKGVDLVLGALHELLQMPIQLAILGGGDRQLADALRRAASAAPQRIALYVGYDENLAHRIIAGADLFLMPSRYEPCGLTQMYSQRYGTVPVVRRTGGLADTVVDTTAETLANGSATGVHFLDADVGGVLYGIRHALELRRVPMQWKAIQRAGMARAFSWRHVAEEYLALYRSLSPS